MVAKELRQLYDGTLQSLGLGSNPAQIELIEGLQRILDRVGEPQHQQRWLNRLWLKSEVPIVKKGAYIYGDVGTGKSMLMDLFYEAAPLEPEKKLRVHFNEFMIHAHSKAHQYRSKHRNRAIDDVGAELGRKYQLICLDEFQVVDIADAMILRNLLEPLLNNSGVTLMMTSNRAPTELYKNGVHRESFLPCIGAIERSLEVLRLDSGRDFRMLTQDNSSENDQDYFFSPCNSDTGKDARNLFLKLTNGNSIESKEIQTMGRIITVPKTAGTVAWFHFSELFMQPLSAVDYLALCQHFQTFVITGLPQFSSIGMRMEARRFVTFIDILYDMKGRLALQAEVPLSELLKLRETPDTVQGLDRDMADRLGVDLHSSLFTGIEEKFAATRAVSRLHQMTSQVWWSENTR